MNPRKRQVELRFAGYSQKCIAEQENVSEMFVSQVIRGKSVSRRIMTAIAKAIGKDIREVFPDYFNPEEDQDMAA